MKSRRVERPKSGVHYAALMDAAVDAIIEISREGIIDRYSRSAERIFGYTAKEAIGRNVSILMPAGDRERHDGYIARYLETGEPRIIGVGREVTGQHKSGRKFPMDLSVGVVRSGERLSFVGIIRDLTERNEAAERLRQQESALAHVARLGTLGEMASGLAHEINQPLTAICNYAQVAQRMLAAPDLDREQLLETCTKIARQAERASSVVAGVRRFVRIAPQERKALCVNALLRELAPLLESDAASHGLRIRWNLADDLPQVRGDGVQLQQVVMNLARNAIDAMLEQRSSDQLSISSVQGRGGWLEIWLDDAGPGVPEELGEAIYESFLTTKPHGLGLGLPICRTIAESHSGDLSFEPLPQGGTRFRLTLPAEGSRVNDV